MKSDCENTMGQYKFSINHGNLKYIKTSIDAKIKK